MGIPWDGTGINCYGMGMGQINMSHGQPWTSVFLLLSSELQRLKFYRNRTQQLHPVEPLPSYATVSA